MRFSEEKGFRKARASVQREEMDSALRNGLWNVLHKILFENPRFIYSQLSLYQPSMLDDLVNSLWQSHFKQPVDQAPQGVENQVATLRDYFFKAHWWEIYDLVGFILSHLNNPPEIVIEVNRVLETELSAYRFVQGKFIEITNQSEIAAVTGGIQQSEFVGAAQHLARALELLTDRRHPDPRNSIKELEFLSGQLAKHRQIQASERMMQKAHSIFADELESAAKILREAIRVTGKLSSKRVKQKAEK